MKIHLPRHMYLFLQVTMSVIDVNCLIVASRGKISTRCFLPGEKYPTWPMGVIQCKYPLKIKYTVARYLQNLKFRTMRLLQPMIDK